MSKKKRYEYAESRSHGDDDFERRARKKAMRNEHKDNWKYNPREVIEDEYEDFDEENWDRNRS